MKKKMLCAVPMAKELILVNIWPFLGLGLTMIKVQSGSVIEF